jgi:hypothetical protein
MTTYEEKPATSVNDVDAHIGILETIESLAEVHNAYLGICSDQDVIFPALDARVDAIMKSLAEQITHYRGYSADTKAPPIVSVRRGQHERT